MTNTMLTTVDNPFDPYKDFDNWLNFDQEHRYFTLDVMTSILQIRGFTCILQIGTNQVVTGITAYKRRSSNEL